MLPKIKEPHVAQSTGNWELDRENKRLLNKI